jgi:hypothetical protein
LAEILKQNFDDGKSCICYCMDIVKITHGMISINEGGRSYCLVIVNFRRFLATLSLPDLIGE